MTSGRLWHLLRPIAINCMLASSARCSSVITLHILLSHKWPMGSRIIHICRNLICRASLGISSAPSLRYYVDSWWCVNVFAPQAPDSKDRSKTERSNQETWKHHNLLSKQPSHPLQHTILFWVIWMVFTRDLEHGGEWFGERIDACPDTFRNL